MNDYIIYERAKRYGDIMGDIRGPVKGFDFSGGGGAYGGEGEHNTPIFTIRRKYSKYAYFHVIILIVEKRQSVV